MVLNGGLNAYQRFHFLRNFMTDYVSNLVIMTTNNYNMIVLTIGQN